MFILIHFFLHSVISVHFLRILFKGYCGSQLHPAFRQLADATSGQVIALSKKGELEQLSSLTGGSLDGYSLLSFGSNGTYRKKRSAGPSGDYLYSIPVDDSMGKMTVTVSTSRSNTNGEFKVCRVLCEQKPTSTKTKVTSHNEGVKTVDSPSKPDFVLA